MGNWSLPARTWSPRSARSNGTRVCCYCCPVRRAGNKPRESAALLKLTELLGGDARLCRAVEAAVDDPTAYFERAATALAHRVAEPVTDLGWLVLIDGLERTGRIAELDWKEDPEDIAVALRGMVPRRAWKAIAGLGGATCPEYLARATRALHGHRLALVWLDANSDSYPIAVVETGDLARVVRLANRAGYRIHSAARTRVGRGRRLFRALPVRKARAATGTAAAWEGLATRVAMMPLAELPSLMSIGSLDLPGEVNDAWARVVAWKNGVPRSIASHTAIDHVVLTSRRLRFVSFGERSVSHHAAFALRKMSKLEIVDGGAPGLAVVTFHARGNERVAPRRHTMWMACPRELADRIEGAVARDKPARSIKSVSPDRI